MFCKLLMEGGNIFHIRIYFVISAEDYIQHSFNVISLGWKICIAHQKLQIFIKFFGIFQNLLSAYDITSSRAEQQPMGNDGMLEYKRK
jgi:hypothetical protein